MRGDQVPDQNIEGISTGSKGLDDAIGVGGVPKGRIVEIYGPESSGKTTLATSILIEAQKAGKGRCGLVDVEHTFNKNYAMRMGLNWDKLDFSQPQYAEEALEIVSRAVLSELYSIIILDSVAALVPKTELIGEMGESKVGVIPRLMSQAMRKLVGIVAKSNTCVIFINQLREKIGVTFGPTTFTPGGRALKFAASVRLDVAKIKTLKNGEIPYGQRVKVKVAKNKVAPPFNVVEFDILFGYGIDKIGETIDLAAEKGIIEKSGSWYSYEKNKIGQGKDAARIILQDNPELLREIENKLKQ